MDWGKATITIIATLYMIGFIGAFMLNVASGPVTILLAFVRAVVWPYWIATGRPEGERQ